MKLSVCVDAVYEGENILQAIKKVKKAGIDTIEFWSWEDKDIEALEAYQQKEGIEISAFCTGFISLLEADERQRYIESLERTIETAKRLNCRKIITQTGGDTGAPREVQHKNLTEGLKACVPYLEKSGITLVVEPLNIRVDHKGYYLYSSDEAAEVIKEVDSSNVKMLFDIYHQQITEGDLIRRIREYIPYIGHFHSAGNPGRNELYDSEIDYKKVFQAIKETGYDGHIGLEYFPREDPAKGLEYAKQVIM